MTKQLSAQEFQEVISDKKVYIIDVREEYEFNEGYIEGAQLIPLAKFEEVFNDLRIKKHEKIALYCRSGNRSFFAAQKLSNEGYKKVYNLELGVLDWQAKSFELKRK